MFGEEYASVYAKVKSWVPVLLKEEELDDLYRMNLSELIAFLKLRSKKIEIQSENTVQIEGLLKQEGFYFLKSGLRFLSGSAKDFVEEWAKIYEIENLKIITRALVNQKPIDYLYRLGQFSKFQIELVKDLKTIDELQEFLSRTDYFRLGQDSLPRVKEEKNTFYFEMNLDNFYAINLKKKLGPLPSSDKKDVKSLLFFFLEINRIIWIYRAKFVYGMTNEAVVSMIPNILNLLSRRQYSQLLESEKNEDFISNLKQFKYILAENLEGINLEREINKTLLKRARKHLRGNPFSLGVFLGFIILHFISVKNLTMIIEAKKLELSIDKISNSLIL